VQVSNAVMTSGLGDCLDVGDELTSDAITADYRILQRRRGHRLSLDDVATAWQAACARPDASRVLDLGCGTGSVLLMVAWKLPRAVVVGVEVLPMSAELARQNAARNGIAGRTAIIDGDLRELGWASTTCCRDKTVLDSLRVVSPDLQGAFELITGTPPYLPPGSALMSPDPQRRAARIELNGGIEDYLLAAERWLARDGVLVICGDGRTPERVIAAATRTRLVAIARRDVYAHARKPGPLFSVWTLARAGDRHSVLVMPEVLVVRGEDGRQTDAARAMRAFFGLPHGLGESSRARSGSNSAGQLATMLPP
jgi:tRNA1(Val) A37 N6-methylase TrmN6